MSRSSDSFGICHGSASGDADADEWQDHKARDWEAVRGQVQGPEARQMYYGFMLAWMACDVATHTEHMQTPEPFETMQRKTRGPLHGVLGQTK